VTDAERLQHWGNPVCSFAALQRLKAELDVFLNCQVWKQRKILKNVANMTPRGGDIDVSR